ncbi:MAG: putative rane protein [Herbinix sp.]|nr:putative rane protein [Herbinix sp.]
MAKCKLCKTNIPEGTEFCKSCLDKNDSKLNESYLDSLLSSVINTVPSAESVYNKNKKNNGSESSVNNKNDSMQGNKQGTPKSDSPLGTISYLNESDGIINIDPFNIDLDDLEDFDQYDIAGDLDQEYSIKISDDELFGQGLDDILSDADTGLKQNQEINNYPEDIVEEDRTNINSADSKLKQTVEVQTQSNPQVETQSLAESNKENNPDALHSNINSDELDNLEDEENLDPALNDLLNELDLSLDDINDITENDVNQEQINTTSEVNDIEEQNISKDQDFEDDDILNLLKQISSDDPVADDVQAISELLNGAAVPKQEENSSPGDVGAVFSDALKAVSSLDDPDFDELSLQDQITDVDASKKKGKKKRVKKAKVKKEKVKKVKVKKEKKKKSKGNQSSEGEDSSNSQSGPKADKAAGIVKGKSKSPVDEEAATKENPKKAKKKPAGKGNKGISSEETSENDKSGKVQPAGKNQKKKDTKEKKKKKKEIMQVIDEIDEDEGKINGFGASFIFVFFGLLVTVLLIGTNIFSYTLSIQNATKYFNRKDYTEAYNEVYGIDFKDEDLEIYDKIRTVMFVNKQLNSYNNYYAIGQYPEALDSLLKGLGRYEKYIELATMLGIESDLNYVRNQIMAELNNVFKITEEEALNIINSDSQAKYSVLVYDIVLENMSN